MQKRKMSIFGAMCLLVIFASAQSLWAAQYNRPSDLDTAGVQKQYLREKGRPEVLFVKSESEEARFYKGRMVSEVQIGQSPRANVGKKFDFSAPVYYKDGIQSESHKYISTGKVIVSLGQNSSVSYQDFAAQNRLVFLREINRLHRSGVFRPIDAVDLLELVNRLNQSPLVRRASPDWIAPRKLR